MKKLLLTGFEPFLNNPINPTSDICQALHGQTINGFEVVGETLPVVFKESGQSMLNLIEKHQPDVVIATGIAVGRNRVTPERIAINCNDGPMDNEGYQPQGEAIFEGEADGLFSTLPIKEIVDKLNQSNIPAKISNTAGAYLCNNVMYHALHQSKLEGNSFRAGFIHIPASHELAIEKDKVPSLSYDTLQKAIEISISCL